MMFIGDNDRNREIKDTILNSYHIGLNYPIKIPIKVKNGSLTTHDYVLIDDYDDLYALALFVDGELAMDYDFRLEKEAGTDKSNIVKVGFHVLDLSEVTVEKDE